MRIAILVGILAISRAKVYDRCELADELVNRFNFDKNRIADWICLAEHESSFNTNAIGGSNSDGSYDHGLFQISNIYWCSPGPYNLCDIDCQDLLDDDISDDVKCVETIFNYQGFQAWEAWKKRCQHRDLSSYIEGCFHRQSDPYDYFQRIFFLKK